MANFNLSSVINYIYPDQIVDWNFTNPLYQVVKEGKIYNIINLSHLEQFTQIVKTKAKVISTIAAGILLTLGLILVTQIIYDQVQKMFKEFKTDTKKIDLVQEEDDQQSAEPTIEEVNSPIIIPADKVEPSDEINKSTMLEKALKDLEIEYADLILIIESLTVSFPPKIPTVILNNNEIANLKRAQEEVAKLEKHLKNKYLVDFKDLGWHGRTSWQRILWQDEEFIKAIQYPLMIKAILINAANKQERDLSEKTTISSLMFYGLKTNRLSYLISVSPNWCNKPNCISWNSLKSMNLSINNLENPRKITLKYLENVNKSLKSLREVLISSDCTSVEKDVKLLAINQQILNASLPDLISAFKQVVNNDDKIYKMTFSAAGASTRPHRMAGKCYEVLMNYENLLKRHNGDHATILGYGLVSHALDARHLAAAIYISEHPNSIYVNKINKRYENRLDLHKAKEVLDTLLDHTSMGKLDLESYTLLKVRLQQLMSLVVTNRQDLGLEVDEISNALTEY